jgi:hypothetical protein
MFTTGRKRSRLMRVALMYLAADIPYNLSASEIELATAMGMARQPGSGRSFLGRFKQEEGYLRKVPF